MNVNKLFIEKALYPAMEKLKGNRIRTYCEELKQSQNFSAEQLRQLQCERLKTLLLACKKSVPAYQQLPITEEDIERDPFRALSQIPILSKKAYLADPDQYLNQGFDPAKRIANITGGSTAEPLRFVMDRYDVEHYGLHVGVACPGGTFPMAAEAS